MEDIKQEATGVARAVGEAVGTKVEEVADRAQQTGAESANCAARVPHQSLPTRMHASGDGGTGHN